MPDDPIRRLVEAAEKVTWFDWSYDNDPDAVRAVEILRKALAAVEKAQAGDADLRAQRDSIQQQYEAACDGHQALIDKHLTLRAENARLRDGLRHALACQHGIMWSARMPYTSKPCLACDGYAALLGEEGKRAE